MKSLQKIYYSTAARNMHMYDELNKALKFFKSKNVRVMVLKGAVLAEHVYKNIALRPMGDIDLLIKEEDFPKVKESCRGKKLSSCLEIEPWYGGDHHDITLSKGSRYEEIIPFDMKEIWKNASITKIANEEAFIMRPEDLFLSLCTNFTRHGFHSLRLLYDFVEVMQCYDLDWDYIVANVKRYKMEEPIWYIFNMLKNLMDVPTPYKMSQILKEFKSGKIRNQLLNFLTTNIHTNLPPTLFQLIRTDNLRNKIKVLWGIFFPPVRWLKGHYGIYSRKIYFYYFIYPIKKSFEYAGNLLFLIRYMLRHILCWGTK
jgi:hypothetical protein